MRLDDGIIVRGQAIDYEGPALIEAHRHRWAQLVFAERGVMTVTSDAGTWVVPPQRAIWLPPGVWHAIRAGPGLAMRSLYVPATVRAAARAAGVITVGPLFRELIVHAAEVAPLHRTLATERRLAHVLFDQLASAGDAPLWLPAPRDGRAVAVAAMIEADPEEGLSLAAMAKQAHASSRTIERLFKLETGLTFGQWRQQARLLRGVALLGAGTSVTETALACGYDSTSAFIAMFRKALGTTPSRYAGHGGEGN